MRLFTTLLFFIGLITSVPAQQRVADSLKKMISQTQNLNAKFPMLFELAQHYYYELGYADSSELILRQCLESARTKALLKQEVLALTQLAVFHWETKNWTAYSMEIRQALAMSQRNGLIKEEINIQKHIAAKYYLAGNRDSGFKTINNALALTRKKNLNEEEAELEAYTAGAMADWDQEFSRKLSSHALSLAKAYKLPEVEIRALTTMAYLLSFNQMDSALSLYEEALATSKKHNLKRWEIRILHRLVAIGMGLKSRSTLYSYFNEGLRIAGELNSRVDSLDLLTTYGFMEHMTGSYPSALKKYLQILSLNKRLGRPVEDVGTMIKIGFLYGEQEDFARAFSYLNNAKVLIDQYKDTSLLVWHMYTMAETHIKLKTMDSAELYVNRCYDIASKYYSDNIPEYVLNELGDVYYELGEYHVALQHLRKSYTALSRTNADVYNIVIATHALAKTFSKLGLRDSSIHYSKITLHLAQNFQLLSFIKKSANLLKEHYKSIKGTDSAFYFQELAVAAGDSLFTLEKQRQLSDIVFEDQMEKKEIENEIEKSRIQYNSRLKLYLLSGLLAIFLLVAIFLLRANRQKQKARTKIQKAYGELKSTQAQLIQSEKMASLGELTAGIAHEIQNPLNFMNNFSEVNTELIEEMKTELDGGNISEAKAIANDIKENEIKINYHGKRADSIVKGMLQHSRSSSGKKEATNLNALADEYLRLSYHGLRARDNSFNATFKTEFDESIDNMNVIPQDLGRVFLNLYNNAFCSVHEKKKLLDGTFEPTVFLTTKRFEHRMEMSIKDNGIGIPAQVIEKIFQPFFTTKPTGQGTGLGLSLSYEIVKAHGGEIKVETKEGEYANFIIVLPLDS
jgi:signal transduction histidine kinase